MRDKGTETRTGNREKDSKIEGQESIDPIESEETVHK